MLRIQTGLSWTLDWVVESLIGGLGDSLRIELDEWSLDIQARRPKWRPIHIQGHMSVNEEVRWPLRRHPTLSEEARWPLIVHMSKVKTLPNQRIRPRSKNAPWQCNKCFQLGFGGRPTIKGRIRPFHVSHFVHWNNTSYVLSLLGFRFLLNLLSEHKLLIVIYYVFRVVNLFVCVAPHNLKILDPSLLVPI